MTLVQLRVFLAAVPLVSFKRGLAENTRRGLESADVP